jgi:hypothetical protein
MIPTAHLLDIGHAIQLALAPVFLLTGIAGLLGVMANRLARIIDRGRHFAEGQSKLDAAERLHIRDELLNLEQRRHLASVAINACTLAALLVCMVMVTLFLEALFAFRLQWATGLLFIGASLALVVGLGAFLQEVRLAMRTVRIPVDLIKP